jgi:hypothetical protein
MVYAGQGERELRGEKKAGASAVMAADGECRSRRQHDQRDAEHQDRRREAIPRGDRDALEDVAAAFAVGDVDMAADRMRALRYDVPQVESGGFEGD